MNPSAARQSFQLCREAKSEQERVANNFEFINWRSDRCAFFLLAGDKTAVVATPILPKLAANWLFPAYPFPDCAVVQVRPYRLIPPPIRDSKDDDPRLTWKMSRSAGKLKYNPPEPWERLYGEFLAPTSDADKKKELRCILAKLNAERKRLHPRRRKEAQFLTMEELLDTSRGHLTEYLHNWWAKKQGFDLNRLGWEDRDGFHHGWRCDPKEFLGWMELHCRNGLIKYIGPKQNGVAEGFVTRGFKEQMMLLALVRYVAEFTNGERVFLANLETRPPRADELREIRACLEPLVLPQSAAPASPDPWHSDDYRTIWLPNGEGCKIPFKLTSLQSRIIQALDAAPGRELTYAPLIEQAWPGEPPTNARPWENFRTGDASRLRGTLLHREPGRLRLTPPLVISQ
jgi:hypothetical protein